MMPGMAGRLREAALDLERVRERLEEGEADSFATPHDRIGLALSLRDEVNRIGRVLEAVENELESERAGLARELVREVRKESGGEG